MLKQFFLWTGFLVALVTSAYSHAGKVYDATITRLSIGKHHGDVVFILVDKTKDSTPSCHANASWTYVMPLTSDQDKKIYAMLLAARATQTPVNLGGNGVCDAFASIESLQVIQY